MLLVSVSIAGILDTVLRINFGTPAAEADVADGSRPGVLTSVLVTIVVIVLPSELVVVTVSLTVNVSGVPG